MAAMRYVCRRRASLRGTDAQGSGKGVHPAWGVLFALLIGVFFLVVALPLLLNWAFNLDPWAGFAIVGIVMLLLGIVGLFAGKRIFEKNNPLPDKTLNALEENLSWIANRRN